MGGRDTSCPSLLRARRPPATDASVRPAVPARHPPRHLGSAGDAEPPRGPRTCFPTPVSCHLLPASTWGRDEAAGGVRVPERALPGRGALPFGAVRTHDPGHRSPLRKSWDQHRHLLQEDIQWSPLQGVDRWPLQKTCRVQSPGPTAVTLLGEEALTGATKLRCSG